MGKLSKIILPILLLIGFLYRVYGLNNNFSFWSDENHVAIFVRAILERGEPILSNGYSTGIYQWLLYWLGAISAKIFGLNEFAIRLPSVLFGVLSVLAIYLVGKEIFNKKVGLIAAFLTNFLNIEILWSRQARPYQGLQFFYLLSIFFLLKLVKSDNFNLKYFLFFLISAFSASLMHGLGVFIFIFSFIYILIFKFKFFRRKIFCLLSFVLLLIFLIFFLREKIYFNLISLKQINNFFYYRIFLTHNYFFFSLTAVFNFLLIFFKKEKDKYLIFLIFLFIQLILISFFLPMPFTRYFYIVFSLVILLSSSFLEKLSGIVKNKKFSNIFLISLVFFSIFISKDKFSFLPKENYSLNEDMQEIPEVDWKKIYSFVKEKLDKNNNSILITNWNDLPVWYLGESRLDYLVRTGNPYFYDSLSGAIIIKNLEALERVIETENSGLIVIDSWDDRIPNNVREYIRENLKKEFEVDRLYPVQPRLWPVEVYSWGMNGN